MYQFYHPITLQKRALEKALQISLGIFYATLDKLKAVDLILESEDWHRLIPIYVRHFNRLLPYLIDCTAVGALLSATFRKAQLSPLCQIYRTSRRSVRRSILSPTFCHLWIKILVSSRRIGNFDEFRVSHHLKDDQPPHSQNYYKKAPALKQLLQSNDSQFHHLHILSPQANFFQEIQHVRSLLRRLRLHSPGPYRCDLPSHQRSRSIHRRQRPHSCSDDSTCQLSQPVQHGSRSVLQLAPERELPFDVLCFDIVADHLRDRCPPATSRASWAGSGEWSKLPIPSLAVSTHVLVILSARSIRCF
jgi:hypothetical protein